ncbi:H(+)-exporting diphosphatase [Heracleum sosnowskyi]|uniref:H(+)-exporting diphosphatase n=1 Tax=Heracleum sosnowskyi TaxID=360622 RepID=A0AAD8NDT5_9APIA|nr:H(+)-exporting diphosphatase [Heracleum sosnowskyi]
MALPILSDLATEIVIPVCALIGIIFSLVQWVLVSQLYYGDDWEGLFEAITGYGLGGSSMALFGRVGGGIYTKAVDVGADLVGKVERNIPEDDPRNPALLQTMLEIMLVILQEWVPIFLAHMPSHLVLLLWLLLSPFLASITSSLQCVTPYFWIALPSSFTIFNFGTQKVVTNWQLFLCVCVGLWAGLIIGFVTEYYTSNAYSHVQDVVDSCRTGAATNVIFGLALGYKSVIILIFAIAVSIFVSFSFAAMYGIAVAALGMLSTIATGLAIDAYGPISDNAGGIAEMAGMSHRIRERTLERTSICKIALQSLQYPCIDLVSETSELLVARMSKLC